MTARHAARVNEPTAAALHNGVISCEPAVLYPATPLDDLRAADVRRINLDLCANGTLYTSSTVLKHAGVSAGTYAIHQLRKAARGAPL
jgi:hypothetical protein